MNINMDISNLKGVGPKTAASLKKCGIYTILDLLLYIPRDYEFVNQDMDLSNFNEDEKYVLKCTYMGVDKEIRVKSGKLLTTLRFQQDNHIVYGKWFNQPYIKKAYRQGEKLFLLGKYKRIGNNLEIINPIISKNLLQEKGIIAKYSLKDALSNKIISKLIHGVLDNIKIRENLTEGIIKKYNLMPLDTAIRNIHFPKDSTELSRAVNRLKFQELFSYSLKLIMIKHHLKNSKKGIPFTMTKELSLFKESLPYALTEAQRRVVREILIDEKRNYPMNRLVQGDVGSGKTIVALIASLNIYYNGYQIAFMAPTEILAEQHYKESKKLFKNFNMNVYLLTGSTGLSEKKRIKEMLKRDEPALVIGTHALIEEDVVFSNLGLIITDEQHRFGVNQRGRLINKNEEADVLVMTATPIPRTLALYLYNDLDISVIDELPPGRKKIETLFYDLNHRSSAYNIAEAEVKKGRQVYIVCPLIEDNEKLELKSVEALYEELKEKFFQHYNIEILHGKMNPKEKESIMNRFKENSTQILISTTVIEVGVNVPNASVMIIENAERFGLSQLHQLRGRVGRGEYESYCILLANAKNNITKKRMETLVQSSDGFFISEQDMKLRGTGVIFGTRQHGDSGFMIADILNDANILKAANLEAQTIYNSILPEEVKIKTEILNNLEINSKYICFN
ncbi:ATP-dependent DNA helicase RecG [Clostridium polynesiense]|uniref:ATP-dependent DNA helicase RecG n=1 Tax=Clostridium polynesiense TaxID=1325933 RepID=UPI00058EDE3B|nr:ATP-dependent DNA helicase RecG [Clostridium polynesiense]